VNMLTEESKSTQTYSKEWSHNEVNKTAGYACMWQEHTFLCSVLVAF
jgi:hypothetical protein